MKNETKLSYGGELRSTIWVALSLSVRNIFNRVQLCLWIQKQSSTNVQTSSLAQAWDTYGSAGCLFYSYL